MDVLISKASANQTEISDKQISMAAIGGIGEKKASADQSSSTNPSGRKMYNRATLLMLRESPLSSGKHDKLTFVPGRKDYSTIVLKVPHKMDFLVPETSVNHARANVGLCPGVIGNTSDKQVWPTNSNAEVKDMSPSGGVYVRNRRFVRGLRLIYSYRSRSKRGDFSALVPLSTIQSTSSSSTSTAHDELEPSLASVPQANIPDSVNNIEIGRKENAQQHALLNAILSPNHNRNPSVIPSRIDDVSAPEKYRLFSNLRPLVKVGERGENKDCIVPKMTDNYCDKVGTHDNMIRENNENRKSSICDTLFSTLKPLVSMDNGGSVNGRQKNDCTRTESSEKVLVVPGAGVSKTKERNECRNKERVWSDADFQLPAKVMKIVGDASVVDGVQLGWSAQPAVNRTSSRKAGCGGTSEEIEKEDLDVRVRILLSELTDYDLDRVSLTSEIDSLPINGYQQMTRAVNLILDAARGAAWPAVVHRFSQLLSMLSEKQVRQPLNFKLQLRLLVANRCNAEFEQNIEVELNRDTKLKAIFSQLDPVKKKELHRKCVEEEKNSRMEFISFVRLAVELYKEEMLTANVMQRCIRHLLSSGDNASLECLCQLINAIGAQLERTNDLGEYFTRLEVIANHHSQRTVSPDVRGLLKAAIRRKYDRLPSFSYRAGTSLTG